MEEIILITYSERDLTSDELKDLTYLAHRLWKSKGHFIELEDNGMLVTVTGTKRMHCSKEIRGPVFDASISACNKRVTHAVEFVVDQEALDTGTLEICWFPPFDPKSELKGGMPARPDVSNN